MVTEAQLLGKDAFNQLVLEEGLKTWEVGGYIYTGKRGKNGWELYRTYGPKWALLYEARRIWTSGVGGGAITIRISIDSGFTAKLVAFSCMGPASAGNTLQTLVQDEDGNVVLNLGTVAAGVTRTLYLPTIGIAAAAAAPIHSGMPNTTDLILGPGQFLTTIQTASLQNETVTTAIVLLLPIDATADVVNWDTTGSVSAGTLAASTISDANTLQAVLLP